MRGMADDPRALPRLRALIDDADRRLVLLLARRQVLVDRLLRLKRALGLPVLDSVRERAVIGRARRLAASRGLDPRLVEAVFRLILAASKGARRAAR